MPQTIVLFVIRKLLSIIIAGMASLLANLKLPITEWEQSLAFDSAAECETFIATRWVKAEKENREFKLERYRCVPADAVYPHMTPTK